MSVSIQVADASFTKKVSILPPYWDDCVALMFFGGTEAESKKNHKTGGNATLVGTPTYSDGYASVGGTAGFDTGIVNTSNSWTHCVVATVGTGNGLYAGNWNSGDTDNGITRLSTKIYPAINAGPRTTGVEYASASGFNFMAAGHDGTTASGFTANEGVISKITDAFGPATVTASLRAGGLFGSGTTANNIAAMMSFNKALSDVERS